MKKKSVTYFYSFIWWRMCPPKNDHTKKKLLLLFLFLITFLDQFFLVTKWIQWLWLIVSDLAIDDNTSDLEHAILILLYSCTLFWYDLNPDMKKDWHTAYTYLWDSVVMCVTGQIILLKLDRCPIPMTQDLLLFSSLYNRILDRGSQNNACLLETPWCFVVH